MPGENPKILLIRFSSIGDIVLTTPIIRALKKQLDAEIHFLIKEGFHQVLDANPYIHKLWKFDSSKGLRSLAKELKNEHFDHVIDLHHNLRTLTLTQLMGKNASRFKKLNIEKWLMVHFKWNWLPEVHIVDRYAGAASSLGIELDGNGLDFFISNENHVNSNDWTVEKFAIMAIGAAHATKKIPLSQVLPLLNGLDHQVILVGGPSDIDLAEQIIEGSGNHVQSAVGKLNIQQTASLVAQSEYVMSPDTGVMHIAAALKKPLIVFWGNTIQEFGMYPYYGAQKIPYKSIEVEGLACRPCSKIGYEECPKKHFMCMKAWDPQKVAKEIQHFMKVEVGKGT